MKSIDNLLKTESFIQQIDVSYVFYVEFCRLTDDFARLFGEKYSMIVYNFVMHDQNNLVSHKYHPEQKISELMIRFLKDCFLVDYLVMFDNKMQLENEYRIISK